MKVPSQFVNRILKENYLLSEEDNLGFDSSKMTNRGDALAQATLGKFVAAPGAGNAKSPKVTGNQRNDQGATSAAHGNDTWSHEAKADPGTSPASNVGLPSDMANKWSMPQTLKDHQEPEEGETLQETVEYLKEAVGILAQALLDATKEDA